jgi:ribosomal protein S18 acetylase RimI-like enzyme
MIFLRPLTPDDADMLAAVGGVSLIQSHGHSAPPEIMQAYVEKSFSVDACRAELEESAPVFYACFYNSVPAGYFKIQYNVPHEAVPLQLVTKLQRLYVLNEFLGLQLGHTLLQKSIELSKAAGDKGMWLNVWKKNERAIRFYQKAGFETVGESLFVLTETHANPNWVMLLRY